MGNTLLILELDAEDKITQITDACDRFCRWAYRIMGAVVTAGIGTVCDSLYEISLSYERAREAVSTGFYTEQNGQLILERLFRRNRSNRFSQKSQGCRCYFVQFV